MITLARLREVLAYEPQTGIFTWRVTMGSRAIVGAIAGCRKRLRSGKYRIEIEIDGRRYKAHRLAWFYVTGEWPSLQIDHEDGDSENNRFLNLRDVTNATNAQNRKTAGPRSTTGLLGVLRLRQGHRTYWQSKIMANGVSHYLGTFPTPEAAHAAYMVAKRQLHPESTA